jgi:hypothetical protein
MDTQRPRGMHHDESASGKGITNQSGQAFDQQLHAVAGDGGIGHVTLAGLPIIQRLWPCLEIGDVAVSRASCGEPMSARMSVARPAHR